MNETYDYKKISEEARMYMCRSQPQDCKSIDLSIEKDPFVSDVQVAKSLFLRGQLFRCCVQATGNIVVIGCNGTSRNRLDFDETQIYPVSFWSKHQTSILHAIAADDCSVDLINTLAKQDGYDGVLYLEVLENPGHSKGGVTTSMYAFSEQIIDTVSPAIAYTNGAE